MDESNVTYIVLDGYVELGKYKYVYFSIMFIAYILIICSNSTIVYLIWMKKNLHEPMYIFIAALLLNSVLYSTSIYPKLLIDFLSDKQIISYPACVFQSFIYYSVGPSEYFLLAAMAYDRYVAICKPLQHPNMVTNTTVLIFLIVSWFVPALHTLIAIILLNSAKVKLCHFKLNGIFCNNAVYTLLCVRPRSITIYGIFVILHVLIPILFNICSYAKILIISHQSCREVRKKAAETCLPHLLVLISLSCLGLYDVIIIRIESDFPKTARLIMTLQTFLYHPLFNPFIYGLKMREISRHLKLLFCRAKII